MNVDYMKLFMSTERRPLSPGTHARLEARKAKREGLENNEQVMQVMEKCPKGDKCKRQFSKNKKKRCKLSHPTTYKPDVEDQNYLALRSECLAQENANARRPAVREPCKIEQQAREKCVLEPRRRSSPRGRGRAGVRPPELSTNFTKFTQFE